LSSSQSFIVRWSKATAFGLRLVVEVPAHALVVLLEAVQDQREVREDLVAGVERSVEPEEVAGTGGEGLRLGVHQRDVKLLGEAADLVVAAVDVLTAVLGGLLVVEHADRPATAPDPVPRLVHGRRDAVAHQAVGAREATEACAHDHDVGVGGVRESRTPPPEHRRAGDAGADDRGASEEVATGDRRDRVVLCDSSSLVVPREELRGITGWGSREGCVRRSDPPHLSHER
jgi:hypothetical protein